MERRRSPAWFDKDFARRLQRLALQSPRVLRSGKIGEHQSQRKGSSLEFADYRNYVAGDDFRRIDWNAYARLERLLIKLTEAQESVTLHLLVDVSQSMAWGEPTKLDYAKRTAAALGYVALSHFDWVTATAFSGQLMTTLPPTRGRGQMTRLLGFLADLESTGETRIDDSLRSYLSRLGRGKGHIAVVISDLFSQDGQDNGLRYLAGMAENVILLHVLDPAEILPDVDGDVRLIDSETGEPIEVSVSPALLAAYQRELDRWTSDIREQCLRRGIEYFQIDTTLPIENLVLSYLRRRKVVR